MFGDIVYLFRLRLIQLRRETADLGVVHWAVMAVVVLMAIGLLDRWLVPGVWGTRLTIGLGLGMVFIHVSRKDARLMALAHVSPTPLMALEYLALGFPILFVCLANRAWAAAAWFATLTVSAAFIPSRRAVSRRQIPFGRWLPSDLFEWMAGFRQVGFLVAVFYVVAVGCVMFPFASLLALWFVLMLVGSFYRDSESRQILMLYGTDAHGLIHAKLRRHIGYFMGWILPVLLVYAVFNPETRYVALVFGLLAPVALACLILAKYSSYYPGRAATGHDMVTSLAVLGVAIPFLAPVPFLAVGWLYYKSLQNMKRYF